VPEQRGSRSTLHQPAGVHDDDLVGQLHQQGEVVGDEERGEPETVPEPHQLLEDLALGHHVEGGRRLVQDHDLWLESQGHGDHGPLAHATRKLVE